MIYNHDIALIVQAEYNSEMPLCEIKHFCFDTRQPILSPGETVFIALHGPHFNGGDFILEAYNLGIKYIIASTIPKSVPDDLFILKVKDAQCALWLLAQKYRQSFNFPVVGITGSNGKTIVKEWLFHILSGQFKVERNPKSYNSQIGVPMALLQSHYQGHYGLFEAGISKPFEMNKHQRLLAPEIGLFTNIGDAHQQNFKSLQCKLLEKLKLFTFSKTIIYREQADFVSTIIRDVFKHETLFSWGDHQVNADVNLINTISTDTFTDLEIAFKTRVYTLRIPFTDQISIQNAMHCFAFMAQQNRLDQDLLNRFQTLPRLTMRMERRKGVHQSILINDSYSNDYLSLQFGLQDLSIEHGPKGLILSDFVDTFQDKTFFYKQVADLIRSHQLDLFIGIGPELKAMESLFNGFGNFYTSTAEFLRAFDRKKITSTTVLIKGARKYQFEHLVQVLSSKPHVASLQINLDNLVYNFRYFRSLLKPQTKLMVMLKAFSYGVGSIELAKVLSVQNMDAIAVAYPNEGVELRDAGIKEPIVVLNPHPDFIDLMIDNTLEPEIFKLDTLKLWVSRLSERGVKNYPVHFKFNTGMNRLGFKAEEIQALILVLRSTDAVKLGSVFSHLVDSFNENHQGYTQGQILQFEEINKQFLDKLDYHFDKHILNTNGILNYTEAQYTQVRLGIGLFGVGIQEKVKSKLKTVLKFSTSISQITKISKGESIGYNRGFVADKPMTIATVALGYADGLLRVFGNGKTHLIVKNTPCKIVGNICMDMCMIDISGVDVTEGEEVIVFDGENQDLDAFSKSGGMISYEVLCSLSDRVERTYIKEW